MKAHPVTSFAILTRAAMLVLVTGASATAAEPADTYQGEIAAAMVRMNAGMNIAATGDVDRDFAVMMIAHHQGAIDMARAELRFGRNERLRSLAQQMIAEQQQQIMTMRAVLADMPPAAQHSLPPAGR